MPNTPLSGIPYPGPNDGPNGPQQIQNAVAKIDSLVTPQFATAAARDSAYAAWVAAGNTKREGLRCYVNAQTSPLLPGREMVYRANAWRGIYSFFVPSLPLTVWSTPVGDNTPRAIASLIIPDPGYPYTVRTYAYAEISSPDPATRVDSNMAIGSTTWDYWRGDIGPAHKHADISPIAFTGSRTVNFNAFRMLGSGTWTSTAVEGVFRAEVVPQ